MVTLKDMVKVLNPFTVGEVFRTLKSEKKWLLAVIIVFIPGLLSLAGEMLIQQKTMPLTMQFVEEQMETMPADQRQSVEDIQSIIVVMGVVIGVVLIAVVWVVKAVVFHVSARVFGGTEVGISSTIHLLSYTYVPFIIQGLINVYKGIVYQVPTYEEFRQQILPDPLTTFIRDHANIFILWSLILIGIAVKEQYNLSNKRAFLAVVIPYVGYLMLMLGMGIITSQFMGGGIPVAGG